MPFSLYRRWNAGAAAREKQRKEGKGMAQITAAMVKDLREMTGGGMMDC